MESATQDNLKQTVRAPSRPDPETNGAYGVAIPRWKRFLDLSLIVFAVPAWGPLMLVIGAGIKILSDGPVLFRQERIGAGGKRFVCLKFRTMHAGTSTAAHEQHLNELIRSNRPMTKLDGHDARLIPLARLLRSTGFDELPQLFNVIRGEMSLVGPRPCTPREYGHYPVAHRARVNSLPGLTGLWQVSGKNHTTFAEMVELDLRYIATMSCWNDLAIILRTPMTLFVQVAEIIGGRKVEEVIHPRQITGDYARGRLQFGARPG